MSAFLKEKCEGAEETLDTFITTVRTDWKWEDDKAILLMSDLHARLFQCFQLTAFMHANMVVAADAKLKIIDEAQTQLEKNERAEKQLGNNPGAAKQLEDYRKEDHKLRAKILDPAIVTEN